MSQQKIKLEVIKVFTNSLHISDDNKTICTLNEDDYYEFKKSLSASKQGISKDYMKTIASFSNNRGGILIFGIDPDTQEVVGVDNKYENFDNKLVNNTISNTLDGIGGFLFFTHRHNNILIGFLHVTPPFSKPVILSKQFMDEQKQIHKSGDIYFRYPGEDLKIKPTDLRNLIHSEISKHAQNLVDKINTIMSIGPENTAIINSKTGEINANDKKLLLDKEILKDLNLIMEGQFVEKDGAPAYVVKGHIDAVNSNGVSKIIKEKSSIHNSDYHNALLNRKTLPTKNLISDIVYRDTFNLPIFVILFKNNISIQEAIELITKQNGPDIKKTTKSKVLERLTKPNSHNNLKPQGSNINGITENFSDSKINIPSIKDKYKIKGNREKSIVRTLFANSLIKKHQIPEHYINNFLKEYLESFTHIKNEILINNSEFYLDEVENAFQKYKTNISNDGNIKSTFRRVTCFLDFQIYYPPLVNIKSKKPAKKKAVPSV